MKQDISDLDSWNHMIFLYYKIHEDNKQKGYSGEPCARPTLIVNHGPTLSSMQMAASHLPSNLMIACLQELPNHSIGSQSSYKLWRGGTLYAFSRSRKIKKKGRIIFLEVFNLLPESKDLVLATPARLKACLLFSPTEVSSGLNPVLQSGCINRCGFDIEVYYPFSK